MPRKPSPIHVRGKAPTRALSGGVISVISGFPRRTLPLRLHRHSTKSQKLLENRIYRASLMPKSNKFSLCDPDSIQIRCGTQNRYLGPPAFPDSVLFQNTIPDPSTFDNHLPISSLSARRHHDIRTSQNTSSKSPQCSISITEISTNSQHRSRIRTNPEPPSRIRHSGHSNSQIRHV